MSQSIAMPRPELIQVADTVARDKSIEREEVLVIMEQALQKAGRSKYGQEKDIRATIDRKTGEIRLARYLEVVEDEEALEDENTQITVAQAARKKKDAVAGEFLIDPLPPIDFGRISSQMAKQVIVQRVREAERARQYEEYKDRIGEIINGLVKRVEFGNVVVDLGRAEGLLRRDELIPREHFKNGDRVRAYILTYAKKPGDRRSFCHAPVQNLWPCYSHKKFPKFMTVLLKLKPLPATPAAAPKSQ